MNHCPECDRPIVAKTVHGPGKVTVQPCGHTVSPDDV